jgi:hypothetical protein
MQRDSYLANKLNYYRYQGTLIPQTETKQVRALC